MQPYLGHDIPKLGFGLMRLPKTDGVIDIEQVKTMVDAYLAAGFCYFDTAYVYDGSEAAAREALVKRHPRDSYYLADKMPVWVLEKPEDAEKVFNESLERTGAGYFDFYLLHNLGGDRTAKCEEFGLFEFVKQKKEQGLVKHIGFSFHDKADALEQILLAHPEVEFVQLQINYSDWESPDVQSGKCYAVARKYGKPVVVMEPVKGGTLASMRPDAEALFKALRPELSVASWAVRFAASLEGVVTVLSGMSSPEQMRDNLSYMQDFRPLNEQERETVDKVWAMLKAARSIPCTGCLYCRKVCPKNISIPNIFETYNYYEMYRNLEDAKGKYARRTNTEDKRPAAECIRCGRCEALCPQHILIRDELQKAAALLESQ